MAIGTEQPVKENAVSSLKRETRIEHTTPFSNQHRLEIDRLLENSLKDGKIDNILTKREQEVFHLVLAGHTNKEIAKKIFRSERTVEYHRNRIMRKLDTHNPIELVKCAIAMGLV